MEAMAENVQTPSSWVYPDRDAWEKLLRIRPRPRPVLDKPQWWRGRWPPRRPGRPTAAALANGRILETLRGELAWAQKCFYHAQSVLPNCQAQAKAGRLADALGRARRSLDAPQKAAGMDAVVDELIGVGRYDPAKYPRAFVDAAGRSISAAGRAMQTSRFETVAY
jgi:hypothetical protein